MAAETIPFVEPVLKKRSWLTNVVYSNLSYLTMVLPGAIWLFLFSYLPMPGIILAFKSYRFSNPPRTLLFKTSSSTASS